MRVEKISFFLMFEISPNGSLIRGVINQFIFPKLSETPILHLSSFQGHFAVLTASQVEDFGLQAILEKMNSLIAPLISGPFFPKSWSNKIRDLIEV